MSPRDEGYATLSPVPHEDGSDATVQHNERWLEPGKVVQLPGGYLEVHEDGHNYSYAYGPKGVAGLLHNRYVLLCALLASVGGLEFGYDQGVIANVLVMDDFVRRWPITPLQKGFLTAALELGALLGTLWAGIYADRHSRRSSIVWATIIFCIGSSFQCFASHLSHLYIGRAVGGLGVGALSMLCPLYMAEISPPEFRGSLLALEQFSIVFGVVVGFWAGFLTREIPGALSWRIPLGFQLIPGVLLALGCYFLPPSPRLLVLQGRHKEAKESLAKLRGRTEGEMEDDVLLQIELLEMRVEVLLVARRMQSEVKSGQTSFDSQEEARGWDKEWRSWKRFFDWKWRDRTMVGILIMFFQQWSGINALLYYGPTLVQSIGFQGDQVSLLVSGGIGIVQLLAVLPAIVWIDHIGRKPLLRGGSVIMSASHMGIALLVILFSTSWATHRGAAWAAVGLIYSFTLSYGVSFGPIGWVLPSEVFPISMRSKGVALSTASNWINNFFVGLLTPVLINFSAPLTFFIFGTACVGAYVWATYSVPETANVSLEEIDRLFRSEAGEDEKLKDQIEKELGLTALVSEIVGDD